MSKLRKNKPIVYIILINWNGYEDTKECIESIYRSSYNNHKVILIDNNSKNKEGRKLKNIFPSIYLIQNKKNEGFSKANNMGIEHALKKKADYIFILNNDTVIHQDTLKRLVSKAQKHPKSIISPIITYYKSQVIWAAGGSLSFFTTIPRMVEQGKNSDEVRIKYKPDYLPGCALFTSSTFFRDHGGFDTQFFAYYEDTDLCFRAKKNGYALVVDTTSTIEHKVSQSTRQRQGKIGEIQSYLLAKNGILFGKKHFSHAKLMWYLGSQCAIKFPLYLLLKCDGKKAREQYTKGLFDGLKTTV